jgi:ParB-like nuclease family protein
MIAVRPIDIADYAKIDAPSSLGRPPRLEWIAISDLVIDPEYQREITYRGRKNVRAIAVGFDWSMFVPVVISPIGLSKYAIVDGQHRTTAAKLRGIERVPCMIIEADRGGQARAFKAINGNVTRMHNLHLHHAMVAAGDQAALKIADVCKRAGVVIHRNPTQHSLLKPGETCVVNAIGRAISKFGEKPTIAGLKAIAVGECNAGMLQQAIIWAVIETLHDHPEWHADEKALHAAFDTFDLDELSRCAGAAAARLRGSSKVDQLEGLLVEALTKAFAKKGLR